MRLVIIIFNILLVSCVTNQNTIPVYVSSYSSDDAESFEETPLCLQPELNNSAENDNLVNQSYARRIAEKCAIIAEDKGIEIGSMPKCTKVTFSWSLPEGKRWEGPTSASCYSSYNSFINSGVTTCSSGQARGTIYTKVLSFKFHNEQGKVVHSIISALGSDSPGLLDGTIVALCRAAFASFPSEGENVKYEASTLMPMKVYETASPLQQFLLGH